MKKTYVLDTNVILENPDCIVESFDENDLVIPLVVIEELDNLKNSDGDVGYNARQAIRNIEFIRDGKNVIRDIERNEKGGKLRIVSITKKELDHYNRLGFRMDKNDDLIIVTAFKFFQENNSKQPVVLVSNDTAVRIKGCLLDIPTEIYKENIVAKDSIEYMGYRHIKLPIEFFCNVEGDTLVAKRQPSKLSLEGITEVAIANEFLLLSPDDDCQDLLGKKELKKLKVVYRYNKAEDILIKKSLINRKVYGGIAGKNLEQTTALDVLLDDKLKVVALTGPAGSGKTLLSISACLTKLLKEKDNNYEKVILLKPTISVSDDIGFLPGSVEDKLDKYMGSYYDNFKMLKKLESVATNSTVDSFEKLKERDLIEIESISFIRGRSLSDCLIIVDEVQNVSQTVIKTILTRVGENCKIILLGDPSQIDRAYLSKYNNGLSYAIDKLKDQEFFAHVKFIHGVRSIVSKKAAELL